MCGFGGSLQIDNNARLFGGCRYIHISDGGIEGGGGGGLHHRYRRAA
jgi:hypothetical protein